ncbi:uncharacterized protein LOC125863794 [Solanum stenotomum]|uniref:uncharacterized protein LOC125863794 n=1 Tax=Solanum stenotomum TaxID=172797 RepID=UPI0020D0D0F9|nr:uncharacterized protein LOC125863794 [Solanum stenotomum]
MRDEADRRRAAPADTSLVVDIEMLPIEAILPSQANEPTEAVVPGLIERVIIDALAPIRAELRENIELIDTHKFALDVLTVRVEVCEQGHSTSKDVTALKADIVELQRDVDELKSTNLSMLFGTIEIHEVPSADFPAISEIPPATTTRDVAMDEVDVGSEAETNEEEMGIRDATTYDDLEDLEGGKRARQEHYQAKKGAEQMKKAEDNDS